jgi:hypothetical protein
MTGAWSTWLMANVCASPTIRSKAIDPASPAQNHRVLMAVGRGFKKIDSRGSLNRIGPHAQIIFGYGEFRECKLRCQLEKKILQIGSLASFNTKQNTFLTEL